MAGSDSRLAAAIAALPVSARRDDIVAAIAAHPVVIVCGETGSGKTTQLPKFCLQAGRGRVDPGSGRGGIIGHTQPRRIAATSVAARIAEELGTPLGVDVGYRIRFGEKLRPGARIKLMTDGILLAETQSDPLLSRYDTIIVDEAHERTLNIDFLLGYLKRLLEGPRRKDLRVVITSATIDAQRFAAHFSAPPAPIIEVSGRLYPVEIRWRPLGADDDGEPSRGNPGAGKSGAGDSGTGGSGKGNSGAGNSRAGSSRADAEDETGLPLAIETAIRELWRERRGDVLVFLPGEREIRDVAAHLARHASALRDAEVLQLYSRLSVADQQKVFATGARARVVLATNVAETSLTVPGIRYVVDAGLARVKRYRLRAKVEQLLIEPISQAAANQRAGRCGRVADGVCVRLYGEDDFAKRARFTDPEILRSSLASVILRMCSLGLDQVGSFPFLDPPSSRAIADGYALLLELGAVDEQRELTRAGRELARFPVDPRTARMLLAARELGCLDDVCVIAAAMSTQDPRERPPIAAAAADQAHARFADPASDFVAWLGLWRYWQRQLAERAERGESHRAMAARLAREFLSVRRLREWSDVHGQLQQMLRELRWLTRDSGTGAVAESTSAVSGVRANSDPLHQALLTGLLGNIGQRAPQASADGPPGAAVFLGAHQQKFLLHPSSVLARRRPLAPAQALPGAHPANASHPSRGPQASRGAQAADPQPARRSRWVMAAELVDTGRLLARTVATVQPDWIERAGAHLIARSWSDPHWEKRAGRTMANERGTIYGLVLYSARRIAYDPVDPMLARELMIREGLVANEWPTERAFIRHNRAVITAIEKLEHRSRRPDLLVDEQTLFEWFDYRVPAEIFTARALERWLLGNGGDAALQLSREVLLRRDADELGDARFPRALRMSGIDFALEYRFEPGANDDGATLTVPLYALNQVDPARCDWLVPGMLAAKVEVLLRSLGQRHRRRLQPIDETVSGFVDQHADSPPAGQPLLAALLRHLQREFALSLREGDFRLESMPLHLSMNFRLIDEHGRQLAMSRWPGELKAGFGAKAQGSFQAAFSQVANRVAASADGPASADPESAKPASADSTSTGPTATGSASTDRASADLAATRVSADPPATGGAERRGTSWVFGELAELIELRDDAGRMLVGYPALVDTGDAAQLQVFDDPADAARRHRQGVRRLILLALAEPVRFFERELRKDSRLELGFSSLPGRQGESVAQQLLAATIERCFFGDSVPMAEAAFVTMLEAGRPRFSLTAQEILRLVRLIIEEYGAVRRKLGSVKGFAAVVDDVDTQLRGLFPDGFIAKTPFESLSNYPRYLKAIVLRLDKLREQPAVDAARMSEIAALAVRWQRRLRSMQGAGDAQLEGFRWLLEELRVSLFAQTLRTPYPVSTRRLAKVLEQHEAR